MATNIEMNILKSDGSYEILYPKTLGSLVDGKVSSASTADSATFASTATSATNATYASQLSTSRSLRVSLGSTSSQGFDGSGNATSIGVNGTLPVSNGGTGVTSLDELKSSLNIPNINTIASWYTGTSSQYYSIYSKPYGATLQMFQIVCNSNISSGWSMLTPLSAETIIDSSNYINTSFTNYFPIIVGTGSIMWKRVSDVFRIEDNGNEGVYIKFNSSSASGFMINGALYFLFYWAFR